MSLSAQLAALAERLAPRRRLPKTDPRHLSRDVPHSCMCGDPLDYDAPGCACGRAFPAFDWSAK